MLRQRGSPKSYLGVNTGRLVFVFLPITCARLSDVDVQIGGKENVYVKRGPANCFSFSSGEGGGEGGRGDGN